MNAKEGGPAAASLVQSGLEVRTRRILEEGLSRIDGRARSRLNQARQAAVTTAARPVRGLAGLNRWFTRQTLMPATGAAAVAALVAVLMLSSGHPLTTVAESPASALDVLDLVTDDDAMNLMEDNDSSFYEWAAAQGDSSGQSMGQGAGQSAGGASI